MATTPALVAAFALAVVGQVLYHIAQKQVATHAHPILSVMAMYVVAFLAVAPLLAFFPLQKPLAASLADFNWPIAIAGLAIVGIEVGFLLTYRFGAPLSTTAIVSSSIVALTLFLLGVLIFKDPFSWPKVGGGLLCIAGIALITRA
jgi:drug/metabolite transporter (DMT)-like permease